MSGVESGKCLTLFLQHFHQVMVKTDDSVVFAKSGRTQVLFLGIISAAGEY